MSFRARVILATVIMVMLSVGGTAVFLARGFYTNILSEAELRAVGLADSLAAITRDDLASDSLAGIDRVLAAVRDAREGNAGIVLTTILDRRGRIVTREITPGYEFLSENEFISRAGAAQGPLRQQIRLFKHKILLVSTPVKTSVDNLPGIRWGTVITAMDIDRVRAALVPVLLRSGFIATIFLGLFLVIIIAVVRVGLIRPIKLLSEAAERLAAGDMTCRAPIVYHDEIGRLADTFNELAAEIQVHTRNLEETVRERTWELEKANSRLAELAAMDELTGLGNRRTFKTALKQEIRRCQRDMTRFSLLMLDVDHFKHYNDTYGHPAGDVVLARIGEIMRNRLRVTDIACRYGGEEFAAILVTTDRDDAFEIAESIRARVEDSDFTGEEAQPGGRLTVSIGVATFPDDADDAELLVDAADIAMYSAKESGRNRVHVFVQEMQARFSPMLKANRQ